VKIHPQVTSGLQSCQSVYLFNNNNCNRAHSQHKAEREAMINTSHKVYIDRSLAFSRENHVVDFSRPRQGWKFCKGGRSSDLKAEREAMINTSHKVYIDRSLAFSRENHVVDFSRPRQGWKFCKVGRSTVRTFLSPLVKICSCTYAD